MRWFVEMHVKSLLDVKSIQSLIGMLNGLNASAIDTILQMKNLICDWKSKGKVRFLSLTQNLETITW